MRLILHCFTFTFYIIRVNFCCCCVNWYATVLFVLNKSFFYEVLLLHHTRKPPPPTFPTVPLIASRMFEIKDMCLSKKQKRAKGKGKAKKQIYKYFAGNLRQNKISWTAKQAATMLQPDKQKECDCFSFSCCCFLQIL